MRWNQGSLSDCRPGICIKLWKFGIVDCPVGHCCGQRMIVGSEGDCCCMDDSWVTDRSNEEKVREKVIVCVVLTLIAHVVVPNVTSYYWGLNPLIVCPDQIILSVRQEMTVFGLRSFSPVRNLTWVICHPLDHEPPKFMPIFWGLQRPNSIWSWHVGQLY